MRSILRAGFNTLDEWRQIWQRLREGLRYPAIAYMDTDQSLTTAFADMSGTGLLVATNTNYAFKFHLSCDANATTTGIDVAVNGPSNSNGITYTQLYWTSATAAARAGSTSYDNDTASTDSNGTSRRLFEVYGIFRNGSNEGTLIGRAKRENVGSATVRAGSYGMLWPLEWS